MVHTWWHWWGGGKRGKRLKYCRDGIQLSKSSLNHYNIPIYILIYFLVVRMKRTKMLKVRVHCGGISLCGRSEKAAHTFPLTGAHQVMGMRQGQLWA